MSTDAPPRRGLFRRILPVGGPILLSAMLIAAVLYPIVHKPDRAAAGGCDRKPDTAAQIRAEPIFNQHPRSTDLSTPIEAFSCAPSPSASTGPLSAISNAVVTRELTGSLSSSEIRAYYASLAERSGWRADKSPVGLYSATKPDGACPWWFVVNADKRGYGVSIYYQPIGATDCEWATGHPILIPWSN